MEKQQWEKFLERGKLLQRNETQKIAGKAIIIILAIVILAVIIGNLITG